MGENSQEEGITLRGVVEMLRRGEDPNKCIPFMAMNRKSRRAVLQEAKRRMRMEEVTK